MGEVCDAVYPDGADRGLQSAPFGRSAIVPVAIAEPRSSANELSMTQELMRPNSPGADERVSPTSVWPGYA